MSPERPTLGAQLKHDLDQLLEKHPAPWRIDPLCATGPELLDANDDTVMTFDDDDVPFHSGIAAAVNFYHSVTAPTPIRLSQPADAAFSEDLGGGA